jgi:hypothetical protein
MHLAEHRENLGLSRASRQIGVLAQHFVDLRAAGHHRVERGHRLLENHAHARAAQFAQPPLARAGEVLALQRDHSGLDRQRFRQQTHDRKRDH